MYFRHVNTVFVPGVPAPQGSKRGFSKVGTTKVQLVEMSKKVKPWRDAIMRAYEAEGMLEAVESPCKVHVLFLFERPKTVKRPFPTGAEGDIDKLLRSTYDGMVQAGVLADDRIIVGGSQDMRYVVGDETPGARIRLEALLS